HNQLIKDLAASLNQVQMTVGKRVKRSGIDSANEVQVEIPAQFLPLTFTDPSDLTFRRVGTDACEFPAKPFRLCSPAVQVFLHREPNEVLRNQMGYGLSPDFMLDWRRAAT